MPFSFYRFFIPCVLLHPLLLFHVTRCVTPSFAMPPPSPPNGTMVCGGVWSVGLWGGLGGFWGCGVWGCGVWGCGVWVCGLQGPGVWVCAVWGCVGQCCVGLWCVVWCGVWCVVHCSTVVGCGVLLVQKNSAGGTGGHS